MMPNGPRMIDDWPAMRRLFEELADLDESERRTRLREAELEVGDERRGATLRTRLEAMLEADRTADARLRLYEEAAARLMLVVTSAPRPAESPAALDPAGSLDPLGVAGSTVGRYRVDELLGVGGMGVVYRATDERLGRQVALKFLPPALSLDAHAKRRFLQEARAASSLDHPNVCTIYEVDETADGTLYIAMACYEGETLRTRLERGVLEVGEALELVAQVARGLAAAHARGLVHRDIKPRNLFVTRNGTVKILDFGIVKAAEEEGITLPGERLGTAAYMAPEQVMGSAAGEGADVFALGLVLREMLTGRRPPRRGDHEGRTGREAGDDLADRPGVPRPVADLLARMLAPDPVARPSASELARMDLEVLADSTAGREAAELLPVRPPVPDATRSIAVLPFADLSPAGDQEYFCEGMAEEILDALARIDGLRVAARMSSFHLKELASDPAAIGRRLDVDALIRGSVRKAGSRVRVAARLVRVADGSILWSDRYDRELEDIFAIQEEIARGIVGTLRPWLGGGPLRPLRSSRTDRIEAYELYLKGRQFFLRDTRHDLESAREMFARAIAADPGYARAHAGLSDACAYLYKHFDRDPVLIREAERASGRAIELDPASADAHASRAMVAWLTDRMAEAEEEFSGAIRLDPGYFEARYLFGQCFITRGMLEKALEQFEAAWERRPDDFQSPILIATLHRELGRPEEARAHFQRGLELADERLELEPDHVRARYLGAFSLVQLGREEEGIARVRRAAEQAPDDSMTLYNAAGVHALAGRTDAALDYIERAVDSGFAYRPDLEHDTDFAAIRPHPRFQALLDRVDRSG